MKLLTQADAYIYGMSTLYPSGTGLPVPIWIDDFGKDRNPNYNQPRVKVQNVGGDKVVDDFFVVSISKDPEVLAGTRKIHGKDWKRVRDFISTHYDVLMQHWNREINEDQVKSELYSC